VVAVLAVILRAVGIQLVSGGRIVRVLERHVAFATLDHLVGLALRVPLALAPVVVLILELNPADLVHLLVDELLVTGRAVLGGLEQALRERLHVLLRIRPDQKIGDAPGELALVHLVEVALGLVHRVVRVALQIGFADGVAHQARDALVVAADAGEIFCEHVLGAREQRRWIVAAAAVARALRAVLLGHHLLDHLERGIHRGPAVGADRPLAVDRRVAARGAAALAAGERAVVVGAARGRGGEARAERAPALLEVVVLGKLVPPIHRLVQHAEYGDDQEAADGPRERSFDPALFRGERLLCLPGPPLPVARDQQRHVGNQEGEDRQGRDDVDVVPSVGDRPAE
jgi:hypothetical protein